MVGATLGFVIGCVAGTYGEELLVRSNPGFFGPDNQQVIDDQHANFAALDAKISELKLASSDDPRTAALVDELSRLVQEQKNLSEKKNDLFKAADITQQSLKQQLLEKRGVSQAVDFWISKDETVLLKDPDIALSVLRFWASDNEIDINLSGEEVRMKLGDTLPVQTREGPMTLIYRHAARESDGRIGFDLVPGTQ